MYCNYYQANVQKEDCWFLAGVLRSFEHVAFDRTIDKEKSLFEFFVPATTEEYFLQIMDYLQAQGIVSDLKKLPNRLLDPNQEV